jgi:hypothetical protein
MPTIATNTYRLPVPEKLVRGQTIISQSTDNPNVPGNAGLLATFSDAQSTLAEAQESGDQHPRRLHRICDRRRSD